MRQSALLATANLKCIYVQLTIGIH